MPLHPPRAARWLVIAVAGVAAFIATFDVNRLIAPGQGRVKAVTGRDLLIRGGATLEISLHPRLVASDVSISNWPGAGSAPLATAKQVAVQLHLLPLLSGRYEVTRLELVEPAARPEKCHRRPGGGSTRSADRTADVAAASEVDQGRKTVSDCFGERAHP
jgi:hypothetical protein